MRNGPFGGPATQPGEQFLATILDTIASLVLVLDRDGRIVLFNRACERVTGWTFEEVRGRFPWDVFLLPEDVEPVRAVFRRLRAGESSSYDNCWRTKDGRVREIAWTNTILGDDAGNVRWVVPTGIDVTERRAAERRLRDGERRYRALFDAAGDAVFVCDAAPGGGLRILEANDAAARRLGYRRAELLALGMVDLHDPDEWDRAGGRLERLGADETITFETAERRRDGSALTVEVGARKVALDGHPAILVTSRDVSERRRLEEELAQASKLEAIGRIAGGIAHDFNNLLVAILGGADEVRSAIPPESPLREPLDEVLVAGRKAASLTQQLLAFGRKQVVRPVALDLNAVVDETAKLLLRVVGERVRIETRLAPSPCPVLADPAGMQQVVMNLVVNARDAMPSGGTVTISTDVLEVATGGGPAGLDPGRHVLLSVRDTGVGMSEEVRQRVFEPFFTTKPAGRGTGLGLASVFGTIAQAGGHVVVESAPGAGACFKIYLPQTTRAPEAVASPGRSARPPGDGRTVLVVEDDPAVLGIAVRVLEGDGWRVLAAADPREALAHAARRGERIDVLLTDVIMPYLNGRALAQRLREDRPGLPVVFMSGYAPDLVSRTGALETGAAFVPKPFARDELLDRVAEAAVAGPRAADATGAGAAR